MNPPPVDLAPALPLLLMAAAVALAVVGAAALRQPGGGRPAWLAALTALTLFLTFDLVVFGAFTRLTDSGLGCPDWPGCYAQATPLAAHAEIRAAEAAAPAGPVTWTKAWIEMIHRYLAMTVGALIVAVAALSWLEQRRRRPLPLSPWWAVATLGWVIVQGAFGKYTVTLKLYPAVVTLHLLGGLLLLALLAVQHAAWRRPPLRLPGALRPAAAAALAVLALQIALGGWVSTNAAVLACTGFPQCSGSWWPPMDGRGFALLRELGLAADGSGIGLPSLVAIHMAHRLFAVVATAVLAALAWRLWRSGDAAARRYGAVLAALLAAQLGSGLSNVVLGWPLPAALAHSAGAAALVLTLTLLLAGRRRPAAAVVSAASLPPATARPA